jgi:hypothetical protein
MKKTQLCTFCDTHNANHFLSTFVVELHCFIYVAFSGVYYLYVNGNRSNNDPGEEDISLMNYSFEHVEVLLLSAFSI